MPRPLLPLALAAILAAGGRAEEPSPELAAAAMAALQKSQVLFAEQRYAEALPFLEEARDAVAAALGETHRTHAAIENSVGTCLMFMEQDDRARAAFERALAVVAAEPAAGDGMVGNLYRNLGELAYRRRKWIDAAADFRDAVAAWERDLGPGHLLVGSALFHLGATQLELRRHDRALDSLERGLAILRENEAGLQVPARGLEHVPSPGGRWVYLDAAIRLLARSLPLKRQAFGATHPEVTRVEDLLGELRALQARVAASPATGGR